MVVLINNRSLIAKRMHTPKPTLDPEVFFRREEARERKKRREKTSVCGLRESRYWRDKINQLSRATRGFRFAICEANLTNAVLGGNF